MDVFHPLHLSQNHKAMKYYKGVPNMTPREGHRPIVAGCPIPIIGTVACLFWSDAHQPDAMLLAPRVRPDDM